MGPTFEPVTHVIFDMDGLLLDSVPLYLQAHSAVWARYGLTCTWGHLMQEMGHTALETASHMVAQQPIPLTPQEYRDQVKTQLQIFLRNCPLCIGAEKLVRHLSASGVPIAIASGSSQESYDLKTEHHQELMGLMLHTVLTSSDPEVKQGKPAPDAFLVCAKRFADKPDPAKCLVFEDAPNGVSAGVAAGMQVVCVPDPRTDAELIKGATLCLQSLEDFKPEAFGLPPYPQ